MENIRDFNIIKVARGLEPADLVLKNGTVINVFSGEMEKADVAVYKEFIAGIGTYQGRTEVDVSGRYIAPGLFDSHVHIESSLVGIPEYARIVVPLGTTSVIIDPHEIANVLGLDGIRYMLKSSKYNPLNVFFMLPSCVPATGFETSGAELRAFDLLPFVNEEWVKGLAEVMNFPGVLNSDKDVLDKIRLFENKIIDGHSPGLTGLDLNAYVASGIGSDHECTTADEALEKLKKGMYIMIREGTVAKNLKDILAIVNEKTFHRCLFATDDRHTEDLLNEGHINYIMKKAVGLGLSPVMAIQMASLNSCQDFNIKNLGAVAPSYLADIVVFRDLKEFHVDKVIKNGHLVVDNGQYTFKPQHEQKQIKIRGSINIKWLQDDDFKIKALGKTINVIEIVSNQLITRHIRAEARIKDGFALSDTERDIIKCCVIERHYASDNIGKGFVKGFGLKRGAIGSTVAHDSHNIVVIGTNDEDIKKVVTHLRKIQGGFCVVDHEKVLMDLALPIAGLMSDKPMEEVNEELKKINKAALSLGIRIKDPFLMLSFLSLPVIPELKITDRGLVDVSRFEFIDLFV
ncbi:MAG: adenine deaminase [bacterium]|nr:adenine deaminase [bacterium]